MTRAFTLIAPYAAWMVLMQLLPQTALSYALRGLVTAALLIAGWLLAARKKELSIGRGTFAGLLGGLLVLFVWIAPETVLWPKGTSIESSPYDPAVCGWALTLAKFCASAFIISVAEELFFRKWLVEFAGFAWMLVLFGVEHMRFDLGYARGSVFIAEGVFAGLCYGILAKKYGLLSAIIAHATTNFLLGLYVIIFDKWFYW